MQVTFPLHTLRQTAWTKYNAIQVWMKSAICNCKERLKKEKGEKKKREKLETTVSLSVTSHRLSELKTPSTTVITY